MFTLELMFVVSDVTSYDNWSSADSAVSSMHSPTYEVIITYCLLTVSHCLKWSAQNCYCTQNHL